MFSRQPMRWVIGCLALIVGLAGAARLTAQDEERDYSLSNEESRTVEADFDGGGRLRMVLRFDNLDFDTPYGAVSIPVSDIRSIQFATRWSPEMRQRIDSAIFNLGNLEYRAREQAQNELLSLREKAYPALVVATKHADLEVAQRAHELAQRLRTLVPADKLEVRTWDVVTTQHSTLSGTIRSETFLVETREFGRQEVKLADLVRIRSSVAPPQAEELATVLDDPGTLSAMRAEVGKTFVFKVTGRADGIVWGSGVYTSDSTLATAAVHAGAVKAGDTALVNVRIVPPPATFSSSTQNGVTSSPYGPYPGAYEIIVPKPPRRGEYR
jgi:hypothetical protein